MTRSSRSRLGTALIGITLSVLVFQVIAASAQEPVQIPPRSNYQYRKDHAEVTEIMKEADAAGRNAKLEAFMKAHPESRMIPFIAAQMVSASMQAGNWQKVLSDLDRFDKMIPADRTGLTEAELSAINNLRTYRMNAYFKTNNLPKAAEIAEQIYREKPTKELASELAGIYLKLNNTDKYMQYAQRIVAEFPMSQAYGTALQMAEIYLKKQDVPKALDLLSKVMDVYGDQVPPGTQEASWNKTRVFAFGAIAASAYAKKDYERAINYYERVAFYDRKNADAYYYIAMSKWNGGDQAAAIPYFARASVLNQQRSVKAREYLEQLYRAENSDSLEGLEELLAKARADLGVS